MSALSTMQVFGHKSIANRFHVLPGRTILNPSFSPSPLSMIELSFPNATAIIEFVDKDSELASDHLIGSRYNGEGLYQVSNRQGEYIFWAVKEKGELTKRHVDDIVSRVEDLLANPDKLKAEMN